MTKQRKSLHNVMQVLIGFCIFLLYCLASFLFGGTAPIVYNIAKSSLFPIAVYLLNFCIFIPKLLFRSKEVRFFLANLLLIAVATFLSGSFSDDDIVFTAQDQSAIRIAAATVIVKTLLYICMISIAVGMKYIIRWYEESEKFEEERRRNAEAELNWLKNQLNPHFLFNTLNNISSLTQIDPDKAQECIGQLSELLRYALYESNVPKVKIENEVEFMTNYIGLMALRCTETTKIETRFNDIGSNVMISPLLFIPLIENAFKHGTSAHKDSFIKTELGMDGDDLVFSCENSLFEKGLKTTAILA